MKPPAKLVTCAERNEMREMYKVHRNFTYVALAFGRNPATVRKHVGLPDRDVHADADDRARRLVRSVEKPGVDRNKLAKSFGLKSRKVFDIELWEARRRLARRNVAVEARA